MTTRAIKKLTKKDDLLELTKKNEELASHESDDNDEPTVTSKFTPKYSFNLVGVHEMLEKNKALRFRNVILDIYLA